VTSNRWASLHRGEIDRLTVRVFREAWRARPEVRHIRMEGVDAVVKDYGRGGNIFKHLLGAFLARREVAALHRAEGLPHVPHVYAMPRLWIAVLEYIDAAPVTAQPRQTFDAGFFDRLSGLIDMIHRRGIAHGDLEKLDNILVTPDGEPAIVDFAAAIMSGGNPLVALALPYVQENDRRAICKLKSVVAPDLLTDEERQILETRRPAEVWYRRLRKYIRRPVKSLASRADERPADQTGNTRWRPGNHHYSA